MTTGEVTNTKFNTTKKFIMYNREKDRIFLNRMAVLFIIGIISFLIGRELKL